MTSFKSAPPPVDHLLAEFAKKFVSLETGEQLLELTDDRTGARYCECHIKGSVLVNFGTTAAA